MLATILIIRYSLFPARAATPPAGSADSPSTTAVAPRQIRAVIAGLSHHERGVQLLFLQASPLAAPFLLFRLKRLGYSNCRVEAIREGLLVSSDR